MVTILYQYGRLHSWKRQQLYQIAAKTENRKEEMRAPNSSVKESKSSTYKINLG